MEDTNKKDNAPSVPLDDTDKQETQEPTGEDLEFNEAEDSFELDPETGDNAYDHPLPYDTAAPQGEDNNSTYDEENPYTQNEYQDKKEPLEGEIDNFDDVLVDDSVQLDEMDEDLSVQPAQQDPDVEDDGYPDKEENTGLNPEGPEDSLS
ncbi:hypothetical protein [Sphingobacterium haloxyli]|uniref:Uncharacterized protein n=1 Tax=Sphingobacterium haloxyli TaxID=2100533 RepID=A0A2S9J2A1_9SPHI|nr:hypothetical protein [Sphingobacterium haloxyli]PRD46864.1 hypothetical protein C5745_13440 [Sphingobacterium haloxyli]